MENTKVLMFIAFLFLMFQPSNAQGKWEIAECKGECIARHECSFVECDGKFYLIGGRKIKLSSVYIPDKNEWITAAAPPKEINHFQATSYKGKIYIICALYGNYPHEKPLDSILIYDPKMDRWYNGEPIPANRRRGSAGVSIYKDKFYISCGIQDGHWAGHVNWFDVWDPATGKWDTLAPAPRVRDHFWSAVYGDKLYLAGGRKTWGETKQVFNLTIPYVDVFDFKTGRWSTNVDTIITQRGGCSLVTFNDYLVLIGGESIKHKEAHNDVEAMETTTGHWEKWPCLNQGRHGTGVIVYKGKIYIAAGNIFMGGGNETNIMEVYKP